MNDYPVPSSRRGDSGRSAAALAVHIRAGAAPWRRGKGSAAVKGSGRRIMGCNDLLHPFGRF